MTTVEILRKAKALLTPETWGQGNEGAGMPPEGRMCAGIAIDFACNGQTQSFERAQANGAFRMAAQTTDIPGWNDVPGRTLDEVHAAFDKAIAIAEEGSR